MGKLGRPRRLPVLVASLLVLTSGGAAMAQTFRLTISGDPDARYDGACVLTTASGDRRVPLQGVVPAERTFVADGLSCRLRAQGRIVLEITHDGSRSRTETSGGVIRISAH